MRHSADPVDPLAFILKYKLTKVFINVFKVFHMKYLYCEFQTRGKVECNVQAEGNDGLTFPTITTTLDVEMRTVV